ncbi:MAG TPA: hypothetical protein IGS53_23915 [Leptolyngbyaceae cyanobacterium M33_DOE_097]|uniref:DUF2808 domain-containing protein n=1 Tax=Oscillatoriales cyanobacterium SpSt-418 TaxID=2282169 RepID=A0A7C3PIJ8_9CYAN|nr:hypothetical protein [Leptolyngbyaceae cyanobacterium M33_DOE_097]
MSRFAYIGVLGFLMAGTLAPSGIASSPAKVPLISANQMVFSFNSPFISSSGLLGDHHVIRVMVIGMSLESLSVSIPSQMSKFDSVTITDETGKNIPAKIVKNGNRQLMIAFNQPVETGKTLELDISGIKTLQDEQGSILLYGVTGKRTGIDEEIPIGTARIQVPLR